MQWTTKIEQQKTTVTIVWHFLYKEYFSDICETCWQVAFSQTIPKIPSKLDTIKEQMIVLSKQFTNTFKSSYFECSSNYHLTTGTLSLTCYSFVIILGDQIYTSLCQEHFHNSIRQRVNLKFCAVFLSKRFNSKSDLKQEKISSCLKRSLYKGFLYQNTINVNL